MDERNEEKNSLHHEKKKDKKNGGKKKNIEEWIKEIGKKRRNSRNEEKEG